MENKQFDWETLARQGADCEVPEGYVYVGRGKDDLRDAVGTPLSYRRETGATWQKHHGSGFGGYAASCEYAVSILDWEEATKLSYKEIMVGSEKETSVGNSSRDWAAIAIEGIKEKEINQSLGLVYVGNGDHEHPLSEIFKESEIFMFNVGNFKSGSFCWSGNAEGGHYAVPADEWEKVTGLNYKDLVASLSTEKETKKETMETSIKIKKAFVKNSPARFEMIDELMKTKKFKLTSSKENSNFYYSDGSVGTTSYDPPYLNTLGYVEVTLSQFIGLIEELPEKPKSVEIKIQDFDTHVFADKIEIGCKTLTLEEFEKIQAIIEEKRKIEEFTTAQGMTVSIDINRVRGDGYDFPFSNFDAIQNALKTL